MAKIRKDYENSWWPRFLRWLKGGSTQLDDSMQDELSEKSEANTFKPQDEALKAEAREEARIQERLDEEQQVYNNVQSWARQKGTKLTRCCTAF